METQPLSDITAAAVPPSPAVPAASPENSSQQKRENYQNTKGKGKGDETLDFAGKTDPAPSGKPSPSETTKEKEFTESEDEVGYIFYI